MYTVAGARPLALYTPCAAHVGAQTLPRRPFLCRSRIQIVQRHTQGHEGEEAHAIRGGCAYYQRSFQLKLLLDVCPGGRSLCSPFPGPVPAGVKARRPPRSPNRSSIRASEAGRATSSLLRPALAICGAACAACGDERPRFSVIAICTATCCRSLPALAAAEGSRPSEPDTPKRSMPSPTAPPRSSASCSASTSRCPLLLCSSSARS